MDSRVGVLQNGRYGLPFVKTLLHTMPFRIYKNPPSKTYYGLLCGFDVTNDFYLLIPFLNG